MELNSRSCSIVLYLFTSLVFSNVQAQAECPILVTPDELGSVTAPSREGLIASSYLVGDSSTAPLVQILDYRIVCLAPATTSPEASDSFSSTSVIVRYTCDGNVPAIAQAPCGDNLEVTAQFDLACVVTGAPGNPPEWVAGATVILAVGTFVSIPPDGDFSTPLQIECLFCLNPEEGRAVGLEVETESHCAGWLCEGIAIDSSQSIYLY